MTSSCFNSMYYRVVFKWKIYDLIDAPFPVYEQEINQPFPAFVFQTPMSSAIFS